jgi:hypothetical protein
MAEYDFEMVKRAYDEMARRAREQDEKLRLPRDGLPSASNPKEELGERSPHPA